MSSIVLDANVLVALLDQRDVWHERAKEIEAALPPVMTRMFLDVAVTEH